MADWDDYDELDEAALAAADAVLRALERGGEAEPPASLAEVDERWLAVAVVQLAGPLPAALASAAPELEALGDGRFALAVEAAGDAVRTLVDAVRGAAPVRAAVVVGRGARGHNAVLGPATDAAAALFRRLVAEGAEGVVLDARAHAAVGGAGEPVAGGVRLPAPRRAAPAAPVATAASKPRRRWPLAVAAAAAVAALALVPLLRPGGTPPPAFIYVAGERADTVRRPDAGTFRESDVLAVTVEAPAGGYVSLLLLDSRDRFVLTEPARLNFESALLRERFELDGQPGRERFLAVVSRRPVPDLPSLLARINDRGDLDREARLAHLHDALKARLPAEAFTLVQSSDIQHAP